MFRLLMHHRHSITIIFKIYEIWLFKRAALSLLSDLIIIVLMVNDTLGYV